MDFLTLSNTGNFLMTETMVLEVSTLCGNATEYFGLLFIKINAVRNPPERETDALLVSS